MPDSTIASELVFDRFVVRRDSRQVLVDGMPVRLGARAFDVLLVLIERRDRVVSKLELFDLVWPGLVVEENNLHVHISALRKQFGQHAVTTVPGRGYRFTAALAATCDGKVEDSVVAISRALLTKSVQESTGHNNGVATLFGREDDISAISDLVTAHGLVTLVGTGGIGKTVLARSVAQALAPTFTQGVCIVDLAPLTDAALLPAVVAGALQVTLGPGEEHAALAHAVKGMNMLILLDNCEHLVGPLALLVTVLLRDTPQLRLLATSQEPLKLPGEQLYRVAALAIPNKLTLTEAKWASAVRLFEHRSRAVDHRFVLNESNVEAVVDICSRLDGIALAIELAAARVQLLGVHGLRARLDQSLQVLAGNTRNAPLRQRTLRAALEWSHGLLSAEQQAVFRRLGVMSGSFGLDASQQVAAAGSIDAWSVLDHLGALVEKSLIAALPDVDGVVRFRMLETMRQYALERLAESGEQHGTRERHLDFFLSLAQTAKAQLEGPDEGRWLKLLDHDRDNLLGAHNWCNYADNGAVRGLKLVNALPRFWLSRGLLVQGHQAYIEALARPDSAATDVANAESEEIGRGHVLEYDYLRCEGLLNAGRICSYRGLDDESASLLEDCVLIARRAGFTELLSGALSILGFVRLSLHDKATARVCLEEALELARQLPDQAGRISQAAVCLAELERLEGRLAAAEALYEEGLRYARKTGDRLRTMVSLNNLAMVAVATGDGQRACELLIESLAISDELGSRRGRLVAMEVCAGLAAQCHYWELSARFDGAADIHTNQMGRRRDIVDAAFLAPFVERARTILGPEAHAVSEKAGRGLSYEEAVAEMQSWLGARCLESPVLRNSQRQQ